jgi:hypothetical protein
MNDVVRPRFHLAFPVTDLEAARHFYGQVLGFATGREASDWIDFDCFGHQIVAHQVAKEDHPAAVTNAVDGQQVPASHFGLILSWAEWEAMAARMRHHEIAFVIEPYLRFEGKRGEQGTFFVRDPSGNHLEFKAFRDDQMVFAKELDAPTH